MLDTGCADDFWFSYGLVNVISGTGLCCDGVSWYAWSTALTPYVDKPVGMAIAVKFWLVGNAEVEPSSMTSKLGFGGGVGRRLSHEDSRWSLPRTFSFSDGEWLVVSCAGRESYTIADVKPSR